MRSILYIIAVILVVIWMIGFFVYGAAGLIHALLIIAAISVIVGAIQGSRNRV